MRPVDRRRQLLNLARESERRLETVLWRAL
jgi:hypothetical protein